MLPGHWPGLPSPTSPAAARRSSLSETQESNTNSRPMQMDLDNGMEVPEGGQSPLEESLEDLLNGNFPEQHSDPNFFPRADAYPDSLPDLLTDASRRGRIPGITDFNMDGKFDIQEFLRVPPPSHLNLAMDSFPIGDQKPGAIVDLAVLLAKMSHYEASLHEKPMSELDNYPIGDALFLSARFCDILSEYGHSPPLNASSSSSTSRQDPIKLLLTLSCYMNLLRIYSSTFDYMGKHLSQMAKQHARDYQAPSSDSGMAASNGSRRMYAHRFHAPTTDIYRYRDLRLIQLHSVCLCAAWDPVKKAASMLLASLGDAEEILQLPLAVRIVPSARLSRDGSLSGDESTSGSNQEAPDDDDAKGTVMFKEGLTNERMYSVVTKLASDVRDKVKKVKHLLQDLSNTHINLLESDLSTLG